MLILAAILGGFGYGMLYLAVRARRKANEWPGRERRRAPRLTWQPEWLFHD